MTLKKLKEAASKCSSTEQMAKYLGLANRSAVHYHLQKFGYRFVPTKGKLVKDETR